MSDVKTMQLHYTSDCMKCGGRVMENKEGKEFTCECAYPEDCPVKKLAEPVSDWISVEDRLPETGKHYLCYTGSHIRIICPNNIDNSGDTLFLQDKGLWHSVTHWQPLPPPPE